MNAESVSGREPARPVYHPAGQDSALRIAVEDLQAGRWRSTGALLADTGADWSLRTSRTQVLGTVAARSDVLSHWAREEPNHHGLHVLQVRVAVELALAAHRAGVRDAEQLEQTARAACRQAAAAVDADPVPWIGLLVLATLDPDQRRPEHRAEAPDRMLVPGPWGLLWEAHRRDPWSREAHHRMYRYWIGRGTTGTAESFLRFLVPFLPTGSPLFALPLHLHAERFRTARRRDGLRRQWAREPVVWDVLRAYEAWLEAPGGAGRWPVVDESHLAHALWASHRFEEAARVFGSLHPFASAQPWQSLTDTTEEAEQLLLHARTQSARAATADTVPAPF